MYQLLYEHLWTVYLVSLGILDDGLKCNYQTISLRQTFWRHPLLIDNISDVIPNISTTVLTSSPTFRQQFRRHPLHFNNSSDVIPNISTTVPTSSPTFQQQFRRHPLYLESNSDVIPYIWKKVPMSPLRTTYYPNTHGQIVFWFWL